MTAYNLPPWLCTNDPYKMLTFLIHVLNAPRKDIDGLLRPLVDELKELWDEGVVAREAASKTSFRMQVVLLMTVNDFPARSSLSGWSGQWYLACPSCKGASPLKWITSKIFYVGHRQWLPISYRMINNKFRVSQAQQVFYVEDLFNSPYWKVVEHFGIDVYGIF